MLGSSALGPASAPLFQSSSRNGKASPVAATAARTQPGFGGRRRRQSHYKRSVDVETDRRRRKVLAFASPSKPPSEGDEFVQDNLVEMIRLQVGAEEVKDFVEKESDKLRESAEKIKAEADALAEKRLTEADQGFDAALDDINRMADELAAELAASRAAIEADRASLRDFEKATAKARSSSTFFQNLYEADASDDDEGDENGARRRSGSGSSSSSGSDSGSDGSSRRGRASSSSSSSSSFSSTATSAAKLRSAELLSSASPTPPPGRSPMRYAVWSVSAIALTGAAVADLFGVSPSVVGDVAALATAAVLGYGAFVERKLLDETSSGEK